MYFFSLLFEYVNRGVKFFFLCFSLYVNVTFFLAVHLFIWSFSFFIFYFLILNVRNKFWNEMKKFMPRNQILNLIFSNRKDYYRKPEVRCFYGRFLSVQCFSQLYGNNEANEDIQSAPAILNLLHIHVIEQSETKT